MPPEPAFPAGLHPPSVGDWSNPYASCQAALVALVVVMGMFASLRMGTKAAQLAVPNRAAYHASLLMVLTASNYVSAATALRCARNLMEMKLLMDGHGSLH
jgi:hypothetical protein